MQITLRQMQVFLAVARTENLSVAAQDLAMSKSAVSQALTELEGRLGVTLFERTRGRLLLSAEGRRLKPAADELMSAPTTSSRSFQVARRASSGLPVRSRSAPSCSRT